MRARPATAVEWAIVANRARLYAPIARVLCFYARRGYPACAARRAGFSWAAPARIELHSGVVLTGSHKTCTFATSAGKLGKAAACFRCSSRAKS